MNETLCETPDCSMPGTVCPVCEQCLCSKHKYSSSCETCHKLLTLRSFEYRMSRCLGIGSSIFLCGILVLFLPRNDDSVIIPLAVSLLIFGSLLIWLGLVAHLSL
jgi:hypothetical protein